MSEASLKVTVWQWTHTRERAALAVARAKNETEAARDAGVARESICRWMQHPEFRARVAEHMASIVEEARLILQRNAAAAAATVTDIAFFGLPGHSTRLAAARDILDRVGLKAIEKIEQTGTTTVRVVYDDVDGST